LAIAAGTVGADGPASQPDKEEKGQPAPAVKRDKPLTTRALDKLHLPAHAIVVVCEGIEQALRLVPKAVVLTPEQYRKLTERIAELERRLRPQKALTPSTCKLRLVGLLDGDSARVEAEFKFKAEPKATRVALGCRGASPRKPELDGKEVLLETGDDGFAVRVDKDNRSEHVLTLELTVPVGPRGIGLLGGGNDRGLEMSLPRAAVTTFQLERLPDGVSEVRCNAQTIRNAGEAITLGPAERLSLVWKKAAVLPGVGPLLSADGKITVRVEEKQVTTEANLLLRDERGQTSDWVIAAPPDAAVEVVAVDERDGRPPPHTIRVHKARAEHTIHLSGKPTAEPLRVVLRVRRPHIAGRLAVGPFYVLNGRLPRTVVRHQQGTILIKGPPAGVSWQEPQGPALTVEEQALSEEQRRDKAVASFNYYLAGGTPPALPPPLLDLELRTVQGTVETEVRHALRLDAADQGWQIQALTTIKARPRRAAVGALQVQLPRAWPDWLAVPAGWPRPGLPVNLLLAAPCLAGAGEEPSLWPFTARYRLDKSASLADRVENISGPDRAGRVQIVLAEKRSTPFTVVLRGVYPLPAGARRACLGLPRPLNTLDRGGVAEVVVPADQELSTLGLGRAQERPGSHTLHAAAAPGRVEFAWRPYRPELALAMEADVTLGDRQALVVQRVRFPGGGRVPAALRFHIADLAHADAAAVRALGDNLRVTGGSRRTPGGEEEGAWVIVPEVGKDRTLALEYAVPAAGELVAVPLLWPEEATRVETKVRVWSGPGRVPAGPAAGARWREGTTEVVAGRDRLPSLVLYGSGQDMPLDLRLTESGIPPLAAALVDRGLIEVTVPPTGGGSYRARFRIGRFSAPALNVEFPTDPARLSVRLGGKQISARRLRPAKASTGPTGGAAVYRLEVKPDLYSHPVILDLVYQLGPPDGQDDVRGRPWSYFRTILQPPLLRGAVFLDRVRWLVEMAGGQTVLHADGATLEHEWGLRGWLLAPRPAVGRADVEAWLDGSAAAGGAERAEPTAVCWQPSPAPLPLVHVPQRAWLLACSLLCLALGLAVGFLPVGRVPGRWLAWSAAAVAGLAAAATALLWPGVLPAVLYGCEPGAAVLVVVLAVHWTVQRRYRRQLVFLPGFTRLKTGSSLVRGVSRPREPSTVDGPAAPENGPPPVAG
jgi:hypothetical protein